MESGRVLNKRYQLVTQMGRNAGRQTWLAKDLGSPQQESVTIKLLTFGGDVQWQALKLFEREAQTLKQLQHEFIPRYRDYFSIDDRYLWFGLVQEYIPGSSLKELLDQGRRFTETEIKAIARQILNILLYLHQLNPQILHRDIKPSNLIQGEDNKIYLVDFGAVQDKAVSEGSTFTVIGTYGYCPLEQFGGKACPASDLYALGATLIHLLTGVAPGDLPTKNLRLNFRPLITADTHLLDWLEKLVEPALENRLSSATDALEQLNRPSLASVVNRQGKIRIHKPWQSSIVLKAFADRLEISIPRHRFRTFTDYLHGLHLAAYAGVVILLLFTSPGALWWSLSWLMLWGFMGWRSLTHLFRETQILFNRNTFTITKNIWGFKYFSSKGITAKVQDISLAHQTATGWGANVYKPSTIMMTCEALLNERRYDRRNFGEGLDEDELIWLAQEIRRWLFD
ncbi:serine/threonine protein kinase [[Leptolyngbya] sp. PCC 7376]|uniref:serine/threonine protein kinase n=1 Tax=[Leptolyngbya] sp. PCC 7376 TaxID=111781 RepID=UPI00029F4840|nr:serine/threonine-protein kinase [[Leptolyngbya] sp. PCC 7376]AFY38136.1 serine/threonine protein kinase [[Leptolyngbya] sp. PCC 7376]